MSVVVTFIDRSASHPDPTTDERDCWKAGDIFSVEPDYIPDLVTNPIQPPWVLIRITGAGVTMAAAAKYMDAHIQDDGTLQQVRLKMRKYRILKDLLPANIKQLIGQDRYAEVAWATIRNYIENKITGLTE